jgi:hypothetical protein
MGDRDHSHVTARAAGGSRARSWDFAGIRVGTVDGAQRQPASEFVPPRGQQEQPPVQPPRKESFRKPDEGKSEPAEAAPRKKRRASAAAIASETVAMDPGPRTRNKIGVGEEVTLTYSAGATRWKTTAGTLSAVRGAAVVLTAPDTAQDVTVTAGKAKLTFVVTAPSDVLMEKDPDTGISHTKNRPDIGMWTTGFLAPDTVNFYNIKHREVDVKAFANGVYKPFDGIGHDANPKAIRMMDIVVAGRGTRSRVHDKVCSGDPGTLAPFAMGSMLYVIPYEYQVGDGAFHPFTSVVQMCTLSRLDASDPNGSALHAYKAGASALTTVGAPTTNPDMCFHPPPAQP